MKRRAFLAGAAFAPFAWGCMEQRAVEKAASSSGPRAGYFPNVVLTTHENKEARFYDDLIKGKLVVINFMYAQCRDICPLMTANLVRVQQVLGARVGRDIFMYSFTLDPERDTPVVLNAYAKGFGVKPGWWFLTGAPNDIELLRRKLGFVDPDPIVDQDKDSHAGIVLYGSEPLDRWAACPALSRPEWIAQSILWLDGRRAGDRTRLVAT